MKRFAFCCLLLVALALKISADNSRKQQIVSDIGPTFLNTVSLTGATVAAPASNQKNCLEFATFFSTSAYTLYILDGNTTNYQLTLAASVVHQAPFSEPWCGTKGATLVIRSSATVAGASYQVNYKGFVGQ